MKRFINDPASMVRDAARGVLIASGGKLCRLDDADMTVVLRADWDRARVALVSGGGSGHEPAHAGFVGEGMLTAAVGGEIFASPSVDAVLSAIIAVTGAAGCLLIVKNYTGDRLNFGLAVERARAKGLAVEMVIVGDDIALPDWVPPRGIAGTVFVHKLAGAAAAAGQDLKAVAAVARDAAAHVRSVGLSLSGGHGFAAAPGARLAEDEAELGLGIHGEPGAGIIPMQAARTLMRQAAEALTARGHDPEARYAVLLNNLGSVTPLEMAVLTEALASARVAEQIAWIVGPGLFMTSLDMNGFSVSLLELDARRQSLLLAEAAPVAWLAARPFTAPRLIAAPELGGADWTASPSPRVREIVEVCAGLFAAIETDINALDAKAGDGDTGSTLARAAASVTERLDTLPYAEAHRLLSAIGELLLRKGGGSIGVLLATFFTAAGNAYGAHADWAPAFAAGLERMQLYGGAAPGDRTMIDALQPALLRLAQGGSLRQAAAAARAGAEATRAMAARAGRAAYVPSSTLADVIDPGAEAVARLFERLASIR